MQVRLLLYVVQMPPQLAFEYSAFNAKVGCGSVSDYPSAAGDAVRTFISPTSTRGSTASHPHRQGHQTRPQETGSNDASVTDSIHTFYLSLLVLLTASSFPHRRKCDWHDV